MIEFQIKKSAKPIIIKLLVAVICISAPLLSADLLFSKSAYIMDEGRFVLSADLFRYSYLKNFTAIYLTQTTNYSPYELVTETNEVISEKYSTYEMLYMPVTLNIGLVRFLQFDFVFPMIAYRDLATERLNEMNNSENTSFYGFTLGDVKFETRVRWDNVKTLSSFNLAFGVQVATGSESGRRDADSELDLNLTKVYTNKEPGYDDPATWYESGYKYFPLSSHTKEYKISFYYTQQWMRNLFSHFNLSYVYALEEDEQFWKPKNLFEYNEDAPEGEKVQWYWFGVQDLFKKIFWIWSKDDPLAYRRNDRIEYAFALEYFMPSTLSVGKAEIDVAYKWFVEFNGIISWDESSAFSSEFVVTPGFWLKMTKYGRFIFGYSFIISDDEKRRFYNRKLSMGLRFAL